MADERLRPGSKAPFSGQYEERGPRGGDVGGREVTSEQGERLPPTTQPGRTYDIVDRTDNKAGGRR